ncbi:Hypp8924 [Branchiostoma lanceolatum]|uniref:Hypp8924 protein n=1 Tax=Branchiostoma lanceolatum TaxID=7740 RepID=A0A8J9ZBU8_BRALA|nr:Hypp8924 [Branchiostoma lanceolatum]
MGTQAQNSSQCSQTGSPSGAIRGYPTTEVYPGDGSRHDPTAQEFAAMESRSRRILKKMTAGLGPEAMPTEGDKRNSPKLF